MAASTIKISEIKDFTGGLNFRADQFQLADNESPDMFNVEIDPRGGIFSRGGQKALNATAIAGTWNPHRLYPFYGATNTLMLVSDTKVKRATSTAFTNLQYTGSVDIASAAVYGAPLAQWGKTLYISNGAAGSGGYVWDTANALATVLTASGSAPNAWQTVPDASTKIPSCEHLQVHANKLFAGNVDIAGVKYPNRFYWSIENSPENWDENDYIEVSGGGNGITGFAVVQGQLIIFKRKAVYVLFGYDSATFQVVELTNNLGADTHYSIAQSDVGVYFFSYPNGLYFYNGSSLVDIFDNLQPIIDLGYVYPTTISPFRLAWVGKRLWCSAKYDRVATATNPTVNFVFDPAINTSGSWMQFSTSDSKGLVGGCDWTNSSGTQYRLACHPTLGYIMKVDMYDQEFDNISGTDVSFTTYYRTKWFDAGSYAQKKMFRRPDFVVKESSILQNISINVYHDFNESEGNERRTFVLTQTPDSAGLVWGAGVWGDSWSSGATSSKLLTGSNLGLAKTVQLEFNGPTGQSWGLNSIGYKYQRRRVKG
jgi:hypothetical protein